MNIRILAASALAFATIVPAANAATVHREHTNAARTHDTDKCIHGELLLGTAECKISGASFKVQNEPGVVKVAPSEIDRGTGGSGDPISVGPRKHTVILIMKADPNLDRGTGNSPSQL